MDLGFDSEVHWREIESSTCVSFKAHDFSLFLLTLLRGMPTIFLIFEVHRWG